ncbi:Asp-tRNA(Asn)/Glu-tRNA(Gln) amidotransferase subunit GatB [Candidatus Saccharibacteria bacterium]|nr:Asp-tRNA(Asn)/Glu-tRNA(Gln) amidotransferase subunit GatB [Candidatus Saccharibacteria bacterium]MBR6122083.1 Asp-tRNA(Asn)/Glu-tRNA(Gln) amidotransferase subunit GatB [Candidatus Saccharibacteria bacterium]
MSNKYEITIGIECHVQLKTKTKLFSEVDNDARGKEPNSCVSPVDYALPGMLPRLNGEAVKLAIRAGAAMNAKINPSSRFDRKHYFYPDSPKGYQITQFYHPIVGEGYIELPSGKKIRIEHAHLEGDAGKLTHFDTYSLVDLNRVDTPLLEIVSMPDMSSAEEARDYCKELWRNMTYAGVTYGDLYNGNMRFDVNISLKKPEDTKLGTRAEIKNLNSFRSVERAVLYEYERQSKILDKGEKVKQETRGWSDATGKTTSQRSKEEAQDYRYMPEPDLPPLNLAEDFIKAEYDKCPELPADYRRKFDGIIPADTLEVLLDYAELMLRLAEIHAAGQPVDYVANLFASVLLAEENQSLLNDKLPEANQLTELAEMKAKKELSSTAAKEVFIKLFEPKHASKSPRELAKELNLIQENDSATLEAIVDKVLENPATKKAQEDYKAGQEKVLGFLVGQVMKESHGKANPAAVSEILKNKLK